MPRRVVVQVHPWTNLRGESVIWLDCGDRGIIVKSSELSRKVRPGDSIRWDEWNVWWTSRTMRVGKKPIELGLIKVGCSFVGDPRDRDPLAHDR